MGANGLGKTSREKHRLWGSPLQKCDLQDASELISDLSGESPHYAKRKLRATPFELFVAMSRHSGLTRGAADLLYEVLSVARRGGHDLTTNR